MIKLHLLHPVAVHFPIALLTIGLLGAAAGAVSERWARRADAVSWLLWLGTASAWIALGLGLLAERSAPHVPSAWETLALHETLAWWTAGVATVVSVWRFVWPEKGKGWMLLLWAFAAGLVLWTGMEGGELVYTHNMGTAASEP